MDSREPYRKRAGNYIPKYTGSSKFGGVHHGGAEPQTAPVSSSSNGHFSSVQQPGFYYSPSGGLTEGGRGGDSYSNSSSPNSTLVHPHSAAGRPAHFSMSGHHSSTPPSSGSSTMSLPKRSYPGASPSTSTSQHLNDLKSTMRSMKELGNSQRSNASLERLLKRTSPPDNAVEIQSIPDSEFRNSEDGGAGDHGANGIVSLPPGEGGDGMMQCDNDNPTLSSPDLVGKIHPPGLSLTSKILGNGPSSAAVQELSNYGGQASVTSLEERKTSSSKKSLSSNIVSGQISGSAATAAAASVSSYTEESSASTATSASAITAASGGVAASAGNFFVRGTDTATSYATGCWNN